MKFTIPLEELSFRATRSGGPGGQHVNTSATRVEVRWNVTESPSLSDEQRRRLLERLGSRIDARGYLHVVAAERRSQLRNRQAAVERLSSLVSDALKQPKKRRKTRPPRAATKRRLDEKRQRGNVKRDRRPVDQDD
ncbi:MAG: alternative ribosome rescue aminoacyl-tRNA hydrolase ArfB [Gemmatimonadales bacterium]